MKVSSKYVDNLIAGKGKPFLYPLTNFLMFNKIRKAMGLQDVKVFASWAAPLKKQTLDFFKSLGIVLHNLYGMSETTGPQFLNFIGKPIDLNSASPTLPGTEDRIFNPDKDVSRS
jgi:long-chain-fatty-acid--CoA ligase ACSBG